MVPHGFAIQPLLLLLLLLLSPVACCHARLPQACAGPCECHQNQLPCR